MGTPDGTLDSADGRHEIIVAAIDKELDRQAHAGSLRIDIEAVAEAVEQAIGLDDVTDDAKTPEELNASNDA